VLNNLLKNYKLIITIVKKNTARKVVQASKEAGAEGGTILLAEGTGIHEKESFWGMSIMPEKEMILTLVCNDIWEEVLKAMCQACNLQKPEQGLAMVINTKNVTGVCHICQEEEGDHNQEIEKKVKEGEEESAMKKDTVQHDLIVTILNKGEAEKAIEASKKAGARGGTLMFGRGTGIHEKAKLLGINIEPEKEVLLTLIEREKTYQVLDSIIESAQLNKPGKGIAFVLDVEKVTGITEIEELKKS